MHVRSTLAGFVVLFAAATAWAQPGAPTHVSASITNGVLDVSWRPAATGEPAIVYSVRIDGPGLPVGGVAIPSPATSISLPLTGLPVGTYVVSVQGVNGNGAGPSSAQVSVANGAGAPPSAPQNLAVIYANGVLTVAWDPPATGSPITQYVLTASGPTFGSIGLPVAASRISAPVPLSTGLYSFAVHAENAAGAGPATPVVTLQVGPATVPSAPRNLVAAIVNGELTVSWQPPVSGAPIDFYRFSSVDPGGSGATIPVTDTRVSVPARGLIPGLYSFAVRAVNAAGDGPATPTVTLQIGPASVPSVPLNLTAAIVNNLLTVSWLPPVSGGPIAYYRLHAADQTGASGILRVDGTSFSVPAGGRILGNYQFAVSAVNTLGEGPASNVVMLTIVPELPAEPQRLTAGVVGANLVVSWEPPTTGAVDHYVLRATGTSFSGVWTTPVSGTMFIAPAAQMAPGVYTLTVSGENALGEGPGTAPVNVTIGPPCIAPAAPVLNGSASGGMATLSWTLPPDAPVTGYTLQAIVLSAGGHVVSFDAGALTAISGPLSPGTYVFRVTARSACGPSPLSNAVTLTVP